MGGAVRAFGAEGSSLAGAQSVTAEWVVGGAFRVDEKILHLELHGADGALLAAEVSSTQSGKHSGWIVAAGGEIPGAAFTATIELSSVLRALA